jgi:hypothetical protein
MNKLLTKAGYRIPILLFFVLLMVFLVFFWIATNKQVESILKISTPPSKDITVTATKRSFFKVTTNEELKLNKKGIPFESKNELVSSKVVLSTSDTAFFVIDPWVDMPSDFLNKNYGPIIDNFILPLIQRINKKAYPVYVFTNNCNFIKPVPYGCKIPEAFELMAKKYPSLNIIYWQDLDIDNFVNSLKKQGINNIVYTGFASNGCVIGRPVGLVNMLYRGFKLYFIPEASAALETKTTWKTQKIHHATTVTISQWMGGLIHYKDIYTQLH